jgi:hypothetical protein
MLTEWKLWSTLPPNPPRATTVIFGFSILVGFAESEAFMFGAVTKESGGSWVAM